MRVFLTTTILILGLFSIFFVTFTNANAQEGNLSDEPSSTPSASIVNSYDLFWPLTAGKTEGDSLYFLKLFNEQLRGWLVFGDTKKADYAVVLGTKRVLEAEKLLKESKTNPALKALDRANSQFSSAYSYIKEAASKGKLSTGEIRRDRLIHVKRLIDYLMTVSPQETYPRLDTVKEKADVILRDYLP